MSSATALVEVVSHLKNKLYISQNKIVIENLVFRLFSKFTVVALLLSVVLITLPQIIGEHIKCTHPQNVGLRSVAINNYCFVMKTYTLPHLFNHTRSQVRAGHLVEYGVGQHIPQEHEKQYQKYYQWVPFVLILQAMSFCFPHILWKCWEDNRVRAYAHLKLIKDFTMQDLKLIREAEKMAAENRLESAAQCFHSFLTYNYFYARIHILCEILNVLVVIVNIILTNFFLGNEFTTYGFEVLQFILAGQETRHDPMNRIFPKMAKCDFLKYGPAGNVVRYDILCVLALNIVNEKIYVFFWFWFLILAILGVLNLFYRVLTMTVRKIRVKILLRKVPQKYKEDATFMVKKLHFGDWFLLKRIGDNIKSQRFGQFCKAIRELIEEPLVGHYQPVTSTNSDSSTTPPTNYDSSTLPMTDILDSEPNDFSRTSLYYNRNSSRIGNEKEPLVNTTTF